MKSRVVRLSELSARELATWRQLVETIPMFRSPFLSPAFAFAVDATRRSVRVLVVESDDGALAFLPIDRPGPFVARAVGWPVNALQAVVGRLPERAEPLYSRLARSGLALVTFDHLMDGQQSSLSDVTGTDLMPVMDLAGGYPAYVERVEARSKSLLATAERKARKLAREVGDVRFVLHEQDHDLLELLMSWKVRQFQETGARDVVNWRGNRAMLHQLLDEKDPTCAGTLSVVYAGDRPAAIHFGLRSKREMAYWFPGYDPALGAYSPGNLLLLRMAEALGHEGVERIHLGKASESYKERFKTSDDLVHSGRVVHPRLVSVAAAALWARAAVKERLLPVGRPAG